MSKLTKAANEYGKNIATEFKKFSTGSAAALSAERPEYLLPYFPEDVPARDASEREKTNWAYKNIMPFMPATIAAPLCMDDRWTSVRFVTKKEQAARFIEGKATPQMFRNCGALQMEIGTATGENGALRTVYFYRIKKKPVPVVLKDNGAAGKVYKVDEKTGKRAFELVEYREYIAPRGDVYTLNEIKNALFECLGIPQAIAEEALQAAELKAAKAVQAADIAAARAKAAAESAKANAANAKKRAADKEKAAKAEQAAKGMTAEQAAEIVQKNAEKVASEQAEQIEGESIKAGENVRKKSNSRTKASEQITTK